MRYVWDKTYLEEEIGDIDTEQEDGGSAGDYEEAT